MSHIEEADEKTFKHWATVVSEEAIQKFGNEQVVATGWASSGYYHIGNFKEAVTCRAIHQELRNFGADSRFILNIDDLDPFIKIPAYFKKDHGKELHKFLGHAICEVPDPLGCHSSYAEHFTSNALEILQEFNINLEPIKASVEYRLGKYDKYARIFLEKQEEVSSLMEEITGSRMEEFFLIQCPKCNKITSPLINKFEFRDDSLIVEIHCRREKAGCDQTSTIKLGDTLWKLKWRLDWAARQDYMKVTVESSGKDHGVAGGSIDSALAIHGRIFNKPVLPLLIQHGFLTSGGKKLSGSSGSGMPVSEFPKILEPSIFLYKIYRHNLRTDFDFKIDQDVPSAATEFDIAEELYYDTMDIEHKKTKEKTIKAYELALMDKAFAEKPFRLDYGHLVTVMQVCLFDKEKTFEKLSSRNLLSESLSQSERELLDGRFERAKYWIENYANERVKFKIHDEPDCKIIVNINPDLCKLLLEAVQEIPANLGGDDITQFLYEYAKGRDIKPGDFFSTLYLILTGKKFGPRAGTLIDIIGKEEVVELIEKALKCF